MTKKLVLIDGNSIAYRAFFALPLLSNEKGIHTNAIYGFTTMLMKVLEEEQPTHLLVAFDAGKTTFRHETYTEYKGGRQKTPPELSEQFPFLRELLDSFNISRYELPQYEADDIIGTLAKEAAKADFEVKIISGDKDLLQLVSENITVALTRKGITEVDSYNPEFLREKYGLTAEQIVDMKALMGDKSDNIPGVPGVGEKTAIKLLQEFHTVEKVLDSIEHVSGKKLKERLTENREQALMSKELATILTEAPLAISVNDTAYNGYKEADVFTIFKDLGFNSLMNRISGESSSESEAELETIEFITAEKVSQDMLAEASTLIVEVIEENYHDASIEGLAIINESGKFYIPTEIALASDAFIAWAKDETKRKTVYDSKRAVVGLKWKGVALKGIDFDLSLASYLLNPGQSHNDVADIAYQKNIRTVQPDEVVYGKGAKRKVPEADRLAEHLVRKAYALAQLKEALIDDLKNNGQDELFFKLEMPLALILAEMEATGIKVDVARLEAMKEEINGRLKEIEEKIYNLAGTTFNINSPKQLGEVLFDKLELPVIKKTKTGYSTSADVLEKLEKKHEIIPHILHYRQLGKLFSTYVEGLLKVVHNRSAKVHTRFNQALTQTGRLSSTDPNLQNIPIRLEEGRKIRQVFIPSEPGWVIFAADYSQIELRVLAHMAEDENLMSAFKNDMDIHTKTASDVFNVAPEEVTSQMRRHAKAVNFGIVYGISDYGLSQSLDITRKKAAAFIEKYLESYPGVKRYMTEIVDVAKEQSYVTTIMQRRRYIPDISSRNFNKRSFAERTAMNTPIQGSAADIIKKAMIDMADRLQKEKVKTRLLLQVHDELIFEAPESEIELLKEIVPDVMENAVQLKVPLKVDYSYGPTWYDAK